MELLCPRLAIGMILNNMWIYVRGMILFDMEYPLAMMSLIITKIGFVRGQCTM